MNGLLSELKQILTEFGFTQRWTEIEKWHLVGKTLVEAKVTPKQVKEIADFLEVEQADLWDAILFYKKYPDLDVFPSGKNISWGEIREKLWDD